MAEMAAVIECVIPETTATLALAAAGPKTADRRGVATSLYGPAMPDLCEALEQRLQLPVAYLGDDGDCALLGEIYSPLGCLETVDCVYYLGSGTGLAEAILVEGRPVTFDKAWSLGLEEPLRAQNWLSRSDDEVVDDLLRLLERRDYPFECVVLGQHFQQRPSLAPLLESRSGVFTLCSSLAEAPALGAVAAAQGRLFPEPSAIKPAY